LKKDPGIPNLFPYKDKLLAEIEEKKRLKEEEFQTKKAEAKALRDGTAVDDTMETDGIEGSGLEDEEDFDDELMDEMSDDDDGVDDVRRYRSSCFTLDIYLQYLHLIGCTCKRYGSTLGFSQGASRRI
jgi:GNL3L/Grn1 putative GTPase